MLQFHPVIQIAGLIDSEGVVLGAGGAADVDEEDEEEVHDEKDKNDKGKGFSSPKPPVGTRDFPLYISGGKGALYVPDHMSQKDFELLKTQIQNHLAVIAATGVSDDQQSK